MAKAKITDINEEIKKLVAGTKAIIGTEKTLKELKTGKLSKIFLAKNVSELTRKDIETYAKITSVEIVNLNVRNDELGVICRKPYSIAVLGEKA